MKYLLIIVFLFLSCVNPNNSEAVSESSDTSTEIAPTNEETQETVEKWSPEPLHVCIIRDVKEPTEADVISEYVADDAEQYNYILTQAHLICTSHNQEFPDDKRRAIGGGT